MGGETRPLLKDIMVKCTCGKEYDESSFNMYSHWLRCECGEQVFKKDRSCFGSISTNLSKLDFMDPRYVEQRRKDCGVEV